MFDLIEPSFMK